MALLECPDCSGAMSTSAEACPHCGYHDTSRGRQAPGPVRGWRVIPVVLAYSLVTISLAYAFPQYALFLVVALVACAFVEIRSGFLRRLLPIA